MLSRHIQVETKYKLHEGAAWLFAMYMCVCVNRVSHELRSLLRESVPYVKIYRYNPKHLYPKLNGYGDNGKRNFKVWQLLHTYWLPNSYWNWQEYVVSVMLISVLNIKVTCEWHKAIKLKYKNIRTRVIVILRVRCTIHDTGMLLTPGYRKQKFSNMTRHARTDIDYGRLTRIVRGNLKMSTLFSCHYLRNRSTLDISVWGCIGIF